MVLEARKKLLVSALAALMLVGCGGADDRKAKYLERGKAYIAEENWDKAKIEIKNVLQIDPKSAEAFYLFGKIEEEKQEWAKAFGNYSKAVELDPELVDARARLAQFYMLQANALKAQNNRDAEAKALGQAKTEIDEILKRDPKHANARALSASMLALEGKNDEAISLAEAVLKDDPGNVVAVGLLASLYEQAGRQADAERILVKAMEKTDDPVAIKLQLIQLYVNQKNNGAAEKALREVVALKPDEINFHVKLAQFLIFIGQVDKAEAAMRDMVSLDPEDAKRYVMLADLLVNQKNVDAGVEYLQQSIKQKPELFELRLGLAQIFERNSKFEEANKVYNEMISRFGDEPAGLVARNRLATNVANAGDIDKAKALIEQVLAKNPKDNDALLSKGRLALRDQDFDTAVNAFRSVLRDQPDSVTTLHLLAEAQLRKGDVALAGDNLRRAVELAPANADAHIKYARFLIAKKDLVSALEQVSAVLSKEPDHLDALAAKSEIMAAKGDLAATKAELLKLKQAAGDNPEAYLRLARLYLAEEDVASAAAEVDAVLAREPKNLQALVLKTDIMAAAKDMPGLEAAIENLIVQAPDSFEGYFRKGRYLRTKSQFTEALKQYERAYELANDNGKYALLTEIVNTQVATGKIDEALTRVQKLLVDNPKHMVANNLLGLIHMSRNDYAAAEAAFAQQITINPNSASSYAQLSAAREQLGDKAGAVAAVEQGLTIFKDDVTLMMGLAGVNERAGNFEDAIKVYEKLLLKQPNNLVAVNNMAALLADHRTDAASISEAKKLIAKLDKATQAPFLDTVGWVHYRAGDYARAVQVLERVVEAEPNISIFHYHLGMAYAKAGDKAKAKVALTRALELGKFEGDAEARETLNGL